MKKLISLIFIILLFFEGSGFFVYAQTESPFLPSDQDIRCKQWVDSVFRRLSLADKVGQLIVATCPARADKQTKKQIRKLAKKYKVGGLLFSEGTPEEQAILTNVARKKAKVPILITFDGEWGLSMRLEGTPNFPKNAALGCIQNNALLTEYGHEVAREFRELGVNVNFAPDADVNTNPHNPVIHVRSFGENPKKVAEKIVAYGRGLESGGVLSVCKHFPGHGDTEVDSHKGLPVLNYDRSRLDSVELYPFRAMISAGLGGVMVGHLLVPALETEHGIASSLSKSIVTGLLKDELGFKGLVFSDALDMKGVSSVPRVTTKALLAGNDMVLVQFNTENAVEEILSALKEGSFPQSVLDTKCRKVLTYKYLLGLRRRQPKLQVSGMSFRINTDKARTLAAKLRRESVTVLGNYFGVLPLHSASGQSIAVLSIGAGTDSAFVDEVQNYSSEKVVHFHLLKGMSEESCREVIQKLFGYQRVIISVLGKDLDVAAYSDLLKELNLPVPVIYTFFTSYRAMQELESALGKANAIVLAHSGEVDVQKYVAGVLFAKVPARGRLSMSIGRLYKAGAGEDIFPGMLSGATIPEDCGMSSTALHRIDEIAHLGVRSQAFPGCQVLVLKDGKPVYDKCFGTHAYDDTLSVRSTDLFDLGSLTNTTATLLGVMKLYDQGKLKLSDKVSRFLPFLRNTDKKDLTISELLYHESGLPPYIRFYLEAIDPNSVHGPYAQGWKDQWHYTQVSEHSYYCSDFKFKKGLISAKATPVYSLHVADHLWLNKSFKNTVLKKIAKCELDRKRYVFSDIGFILLQQVVEAIAGQSIDTYLAKEFYTPMGLKHTLYLPLRSYSKEQVMPTSDNDFLRRQAICGYVHDEAAAFLGGISGNAGLFSTAEDLGRVYQMLLNGGELDGKRYLTEATCHLFTTATSKLSHRGLGFDKPDLMNPKNSPCTSLAGASAYGHEGFTGTCVWVDSMNKIIFIFLSNRMCPDVWNTKLDDLHIRKEIQQVIYKSLK